MRRKAKCLGSLQINGPWDANTLKHVVIKDNVHFAGHFFLDGRGGLEIGENCHIARGFVCYTANHQYEGDAIPYDNTLVRKKVIIEDNVWIGANVCIVPGVRICEGAVLGMGSVVVKDVPSMAIMGGNPARVLKYRDTERYTFLCGEGRFGGTNGKLFIKK